MFDGRKVTRLSIPGWEGVYRAEIQPGVVSFIAVHDTSRGWALGGCRMVKYKNEASALTDVLRLSRGMTFKNAIAELPLGGGKAVIVSDPKVAGSDRDELLASFGKFVAWVNRKRDRYCTAEDMNTTVADMHVVKEHTKNIFGTDVDPSPYTAWGVFCAIAFSVNYFHVDLFEGRSSLEGKKVLVQGLGKVGRTLCKYLHDAGAILMVSDIYDGAIKWAQETFPGVIVIPVEDCLTTEADVFAPCARGEVVTVDNVQSLKFKIVCGAANNQLQNVSAGLELHKRGIAYCPDYIANMGGVCSLQYLEIEGLSEEETRKRIETTVRKMSGLTFRTAFRNNLSYSESVDYVVKKILWGKKETQNREFSTKEVFPLTALSEPLD